MANLSDYIHAAWQTFLTAWRYQFAVVDESPITVAKVVTALVLVLVGYFLSAQVSKRLAQKLFSRLRLKRGALVAIQSITFYVLLAFFVLIAFKLVHIPLTVFTVLGGAIAIGVGFGSQNIVNNFISGLIVLIEQPVRAGDIIEFAGMRGVVKRIGARSTIVTTAENMDVIVPNSHLLENNIVNWTLGDNTVRRTVKIGVAYGSPLRTVEKLLLEAATQNEKVLRSPAALVLLQEFGENALEFELRFWVSIARLSESLVTESEIRYKISELFEQAGISIPFPQRDLHLDAKQPLQVRVVAAE